MIKFVTGNILESEADALVNTVNTEGIMGKGIALQFKKAFPSNFKFYEKACKNKEFNIGEILVFKDRSLMTGEKWIINFPTKTTWRKPSEYQYIEKGLDALIEKIKEYPIRSVAIPPLGSGQGGLNWQKVKEILTEKLEGLNYEIIIYEPNDAVKKSMKRERVKLTEARALLLYVLYDLVKQGEFVSEFSAEKVCYFLQRFGGQRYLKLNYTPNFYGPYSGKVRFVINYLNGSYIMGFSGMDKKPFEPLSLVPDGFQDVQHFINSNKELNNIAKKTTSFLNGFYSDFALELLSSIDFIQSQHNVNEVSEIKKALSAWSDRKRTLFTNDRFINIATDHLKSASFVLS